MELHDNLYALGLQLGRDVFDDPESFRGALDDFLDEGDASTGDINLLVDAVRLGAFRSMVNILDSGADAPRAIEEAGNRLARDRGSADVAGAQWACAVLGFAVGKVADADVRRYRTQTPGRSTQTPPAAETMLPTTPPSTAGHPPAEPTAFPGTAGSPSPTPAARWSGPAARPRSRRRRRPSSRPPGLAGRPVSPVSPGQPAPGSSPLGQGAGLVLGAAGPGRLRPRRGASTKKKSKTVPIVIAVVAVLVIIAEHRHRHHRHLRRGRRPRTGQEETTARRRSRPTSTPSTSGTPASRPSSPPAWTSATEGEMASGQEENLVCTYADGELRLITYSAEADLMAGRVRDVDLDAIGGRYFDSGSGVVYGFKPDNDTTDSIDAPFLFWDNKDALQSARYQANVGVELDALVATFESTQPSIEYPTKPTDPELKAFADKFVKVGTCQRINTFTAGEVEEISCSGPQGITPYFGKFETFADMKAYRKIKLGFAKEDKTKNRVWNLSGVKVGSLFDYTINDDGRAARYWDDPKCLCYGEAYQEDGDADALNTWWSS